MEHEYYHTHTHARIEMEELDDDSEDEPPPEWKYERFAGDFSDLTAEERELMCLWTRFLDNRRYTLATLKDDVKAFSHEHKPRLRHELRMAFVVHLQCMCAHASITPDVRHTAPSRW